MREIDDWMGDGATILGLSVPGTIVSAIEDMLGVSAAGGAAFGAPSIRAFERSSREGASRFSPVKTREDAANGEVDATRLGPRTADGDGFNNLVAAENGSPVSLFIGTARSVV